MKEFMLAFARLIGLVTSQGKHRASYPPRRNGSYPYSSVRQDTRELRKRLRHEKRMGV